MCESKGGWCSVSNWVLACLFGLLPCAQALAQETVLKIPAAIENISEDQSSLSVLPKNEKGNVMPMRLSVGDKDLRTQLKIFHVGDHVLIETKDNKNLTAISVERRALTFPGRFAAMIVAALITIAVYWLLLLGRNPAKLALGQDNRYSNSKFQVAVWFAVLIVAYVAVTAVRWWHVGPEFIGGIDIPQNLLALSGISALTFAAAKGITVAKVDAANAALAAAAASGAPARAAAAAPAATAPVGPKSGDATPSFPGDLVTNDKGAVDVGDFQMLVVTLLAVLVYLVQVFNFLGSIELARIVTLPEVDTALLSSFGLSQAAYLTKKSLGRVGET